MKKTLQIEEIKARSMYKTASPEFKQMLEDTFGKEFFKLPVEDRIFSLEDALSETGRPPIPDFDCVPEDWREVFKETYALFVVTEAFNEGKRIDIYDSSKCRNYPYFRNSGSASAFGFGDSYYVSTGSGAGSGSRLTLINPNHSKIVGERFLSNFRNMLSK